MLIEVRLVQPLKTANSIFVTLLEINLPESITMIGSRAFEGCSNLTSIDIPNSVTEIEYLLK